MADTPSPSPSPARARLEDLSRPWLVRMTALPKQAVPLATVGLFVIAIFAPAPMALAAVVILGLFLIWLTFLAWPAVGVGGRLMRLVMVGLVVVLGATRL